MRDPHHAENSPASPSSARPTARRRRSRRCGPRRESPSGRSCRRAESARPGRRSRRRAAPAPVAASRPGTRGRRCLPPTPGRRATDRSRRRPSGRTRGRRGAADRRCDTSAPAPTTSTRAIATSTVIRSSRARSARRPTDWRPSRRTCCGLTLAGVHAGIRPNPHERQRRQHRGRDDEGGVGRRPIEAWHVDRRVLREERQPPRARAAGRACPRRPRGAVTRSSSCRTSRAVPAPSAARTAISCCRPAPRAS